MILLIRVILSVLLYVICWLVEKNVILRRKTVEKNV
jgi:hypothetical protein